MFASILTIILSSPASAGTPEVAVVGVHIDGLTDEDALSAVETLARSLDEQGTLQAVPPQGVQIELAGREALVIEGAFLGPGRRQLDEGRVLYERGEFDDAIPALEDAVASLEDGLPGARDVHELIDALLLLGLARFGSGDLEGSTAAYERVVVLEPQRELDPVNFSPKIIRFYEGVRQIVLARQTAQLSVQAPAGALVMVDGRDVALSAVVALPPGVHYVRITGEQGRREFSRMVLREGDETVIRADLSQRSLASAGATAELRATQIELLYRSLGAHVGTDLVLLGGMLDETQVGLQLYEPRTGTFSKPVQIEAGSDAVDSMLDLVPGLARFVSDQGALRTDRVSHRVLPLDISDNNVLASMLLDPEPIVRSVDPEPARRWWLWAGAGAVAVGGATGLVIALTGSKTPTDPGGTIVVGPYP